MPAAQEDYVDPAWVRACQEELGVRLTVCEIDAGHILYLERTALVAKQIQAFLGEEGADG